LGGGEMKAGLPLLIALLGSLPWLVADAQDRRKAPPKAELGPAQLSLRVAGNEVVGVVLDDSTITAVVGVEVWLIGTESESDTAWRYGLPVLMRTNSDSLGIWRVRAPADGYYVLQARRIGYRTWSRGVRIDPGGGRFQLVRLEPIHETLQPVY